MIRHPETIKPNVSKELQFEVVDDDPGSALEKLLHRILEEVVFLKDREQLLMRLTHFECELVQPGRWKAIGRYEGSAIPMDPHILGTDVKAVTWHRFHIEPRSDGRDFWRATVLLDV